MPIPTLWRITATKQLNVTSSAIEDFTSRVHQTVIRGDNHKCTRFTVMSVVVDYNAVVENNKMIDNGYRAKIFGFYSDDQGWSCAVKEQLDPWALRDLPEPVKRMIDLHRPSWRTEALLTK